MLNYILYTKLFDFLLVLFAYINIILNNSVLPINTAKKHKNSSIISFKKRVAVFYFIILLLLMLFFLYKNVAIYSILFIIITLKTIYDIYVNITRESIDLSIRNKQLYTFATFLLFALFCSNSSTIYINTFNYLNHTAKEILLIFYLIIKTMTYLLFLLINFSILISNLKILFGKYILHLVSKMKSFLNKEIVLNWYNFYLYKKYKNKASLILDKIIYFISFPFYSIIITIIYIVIKIYKALLKAILNIFGILSDFDKNRYAIINRILKISSIVSLIIIYIIILYNDKLFSAKLSELYTLIITVIMIPIIYDSIKTHNQRNNYS